MASAGAILGPSTLRLLRVAVVRTTKAVRIKLADATRSLQGQAQHAPITIKSGYTGRQPIHPAALLKQQKRSARWFSTAASKSVHNVLRRFVSFNCRSSPPIGSSRLPSSDTARRIAQFSGRAPFASTLRPNLTGGALPRATGGYGLGGGARYFSHAPAAPAQVVQNVSQAMRAFFLSGQKIKYDGVGAHGKSQYRAVSKLEDDASRRLAEVSRSAPGAFIDFDLSPTITALSPLAAAVARVSGSSGSGDEAPVLPTTLHTEGFLDVLSVDFNRVLHDLTAVYADLKRLSALGDLPIVRERDTLRVRFPGVDAWTVERLCDDVGVQRGVVGQDCGLDAAVGAPVALKLPFAPDSEGELLSRSDSARSLAGHGIEDSSSLRDDDSFLHEAFVANMEESSWPSETEGYDDVSALVSSSGFEGLEGIYRFLEECDRGQGRLG
ncbi:casein kinase II beta 2 subunit [Hirsutella rhossiliensis]|uniref:Casein kinase II beta 2 subunit n=1 Tax=Hirsutella rhossiliensis TaxID=111463 RepID=A0A9P8SJ64_9HYPO|nr:casein kinase II beta 2 subunit [Hirsutella rhossiliensis]KAH0963365.1 casein kinase II beta 2 subunit [Hirsutella rhossiliensis]